MAVCVKCRDREATAKCVTCQRCRSYIHRWSGESGDRIVEHFGRLDLRLSLLTTFAVVKDERPVYVDQKELIGQKIIFAGKAKRRAKATVVSIKRAEQMRKRA